MRAAHDTARRAHTRPGSRRAGTRAPDTCLALAAHIHDSLSLPAGDPPPNLDVRPHNFVSHAPPTYRPAPQHTRSPRTRAIFARKHYMIAMLGAWLGFDSGDASSRKGAAATPAPPVTPAPKPLSIEKTARRSRSPDTPPSAMPRTKSHELLASTELISFLCKADESIKAAETPLDAAAVDRLETLQTQAALDDCDVLTDIVDHLQDENDRLKRILAQRRFGGSASRPLYSSPAASRLVSC